MLRKIILCLSVIMIFNSCVKESQSEKKIERRKIEKKLQVVVDCHYTFAEAIAGTRAPKSITNQLVLITVRYFSTDHKIHEGQILTNKANKQALTQIFDFIFRQHFPVAKVIPVVYYKWNDDLSMQDNNSYSFCYRNTSYSKHATGMAMDINPYFNPVRWKNGFRYRSDKPIGAVYNLKQPGTFYPSHPVVLEFKKLGFRWGHYFSRNFDDHHFER